MLTSESLFFSSIEPSFSLPQNSAYAVISLYAPVFTDALLHKP